MLKRYLLAGCLAIGLGFIGQMAYSATNLTMSGDIEEGGGAATGAAISSGANASSPGVSAEVQLEMEMPDIIAMAIYQGGDVNTTQGAPLLAGRYAAGLNSNLSLTNVADILNDVVKGGNEIDKNTNTDVLKIGGVVYSSTGLATLTVEPVTQGGTTDLPANHISVEFTNVSGGDGSIIVGFEGTFTEDGTTVTAFEGDETSITTGPVAMANTDNRGTFLLYGDVIESSLDTFDDIGTYEGTLTITTVLN